MAFATIQAVSNILMLLPMRTQLLLEIVRIGKICYILELINANDNFKTLFLQSSPQDQAPHQDSVSQFPNQNRLIPHW